MPVYVYRCLHCKNDFEHFQKMSASPLEICSGCGSTGIFRIPQGFSFTGFREKGKVVSTRTSKKGRITRNEHLVEGAVQDVLEADER